MLFSYFTLTLFAAELYFFFERFSYFPLSFRCRCKVVLLLGLPARNKLVLSFAFPLQPLSFRNLLSARRNSPWKQWVTCESKVFADVSVTFQRRTAIKLSITERQGPVEQFGLTFYSGYYKASLHSLWLTERIHTHETEESFLCSILLCLLESASLISRVSNIDIQWYLYWWFTKVSNTNDN